MADLNDLAVAQLRQFEKDAPSYKKCGPFYTSFSSGEARPTLRGALVLGRIVGWADSMLMGLGGR